MKGEYADIVIAGGGLSGALAALALRKVHPDLRLVLIAAGEQALTERIWPCFLADIPAADRWLVEPLFDGAWRKYEVRFPRFMRVVNSSCRMITGEQIDAALRDALAEDALLTREFIAGLDAGGVTLGNGRRIHARAVIDARAGTIFPHLAGGWRVSYGKLLRFEHKHPFAHPLLMDLRVSQRDGCRVISCVPISIDTVYICETLYSETASSESDGIDPAEQSARIEDYCRIANWRVAEVLHEQSDVVPLVGAGDFDAFWVSGEGGVARIGAWAGLLHPFLGSEIGSAVSTALRLAELPDPSGQAFARVSRDIAVRHWRRTGFGRLLVRLLFAASGPRRRYKLFEAIYRLDQALIERFHTSSSTLFDRARILLGARVPLGRGLSAALDAGPALAPLDEADAELGHPARTAAS